MKRLPSSVEEAQTTVLYCIYSCFIFPLSGIVGIILFPSSLSAKYNILCGYPRVLIVTVLNHSIFINLRAQWALLEPLAAFCPLLWTCVWICVCALGLVWDPCKSTHQFSCDFFRVALFISSPFCSLFFSASPPSSHSPRRVARCENSKNVYH